MPFQALRPAPDCPASTGQRPMLSTAAGPVVLPSGERIPSLGQTTRGLGADPDHYADELDVLRLGLDLGMSLIEAAEGYDDDGAERLVRDAVRSRRDEVFLVVAAMPGRRSARAIVAACERSLRRLGTDRIDLYVTQGPGRGQRGHDTHETLVAMGALLLNGKVRYWGVADVDPRDLDELGRIGMRTGLAACQVRYNLARRAMERELLPWSRTHALPLMAHSPLATGSLFHHPALRALADQHGCTTAQLALAWVLRQAGMCALVRARSSAHLRQNRCALELRLDAGAVDALDRAFPVPLPTLTRRYAVS